MSSRLWLLLLLPRWSARVSWLCPATSLCPGEGWPAVGRQRLLETARGGGGQQSEWRRVFGALWRPGQKQNLGGGQRLRSGIHTSLLSRLCPHSRGLPGGLCGGRFPLAVSSHPHGSGDGAAGFQRACYCRREGEQLHWPPGSCRDRAGGGAGGGASMANATSAEPLATQPLLASLRGDCTKLSWPFLPGAVRGGGKVMVPYLGPGKPSWGAGGGVIQAGKGAGSLLLAWVRDVCALWSRAARGVLGQGSLITQQGRPGPAQRAAPLLPPLSWVLRAGEGRAQRALGQVAFSGLPRGGA